MARLRVTRDDGQTILFVGIPLRLPGWTIASSTGISSRLRKAFLDCLRDIRKTTGNYLLINQHVAPAFRFSPGQIDLSDPDVLEQAT
jgi:hypothetical protein